MGSPWKTKFHFYYNYIYSLRPTAILQKSFHELTTPVNLLQVV
jgi:hypothetical protein